MGKIQFSPTSTTSPSKTSPWEQPILVPAVDPNQIGPTRIKLVFDDDQEATTKDNLLLEDISRNSLRKKIL